MVGIRVLTFVAFLALLSDETLVAKDKGGKGSKGPVGSPGHQPPAAKGPKATASKVGASVDVHLSLGTNDRQIIQRYVNEFRISRKSGMNVGGLPPGLAKKVARGGELPPGWQKQCGPGAIMPLAVFNVCHPLPHALVVKLPPPPPDMTIVAVDGRVFLIHKHSRKIHAGFEVEL
jgi:hypothetical protein